MGEDDILFRDDYSIVSDIGTLLNLLGSASFGWVGVTEGWRHWSVCDLCICVYKNVGNICVTFGGLFSAVRLLHAVTNRGC
jgi:hypothetical protein